MRLFPSYVHVQACHRCSVFIFPDCHLNKFSTNCFVNFPRAEASRKKVHFSPLWRRWNCCKAARGVLSYQFESIIGKHCAAYLTMLCGSTAAQLSSTGEALHLGEISGKYSIFHHTSSFIFIKHMRGELFFTRPGLSRTQTFFAGLVMFFFIKNFTVFLSFNHCLRWDLNENCRCRLIPGGTNLLLIRSVGILVNCCFIRLHTFVYLIHSQKQCYLLIWQIPLTENNQLVQNQEEKKVQNGPDWSPQLSNPSSP